MQKWERFGGQIKRVALAKLLTETRAGTQTHWLIERNVQPNLLM